MGLVEKVRDLLEAAHRYFAEFAPAQPTEPEAFRYMMTKAMPSCPVCGQTIVGHQYQQIASTPIKAENAEELHALFEAVRLHQWEDLRHFQAWEGDCSDAEVVLFRCPNGSYNLTLLYDPFELTENTSLLRQEEIEADDLPVLLRDWKQLTWS